MVVRFIALLFLQDCEIIATFCFVLKSYLNHNGRIELEALTNNVCQILLKACEHFSCMFSLSFISEMKEQAGGLHDWT